MQIENETHQRLKDASRRVDAGDEYKYGIYTTVYCVVLVIGLISNLTALYVFCRHVKKKRAATICLLNLAVADLLFLLTLPFRISYYHSGASWSFGDVMCRISVCAFYFSMYASIFFLTLLSICRYLAIVRPHQVNIKNTTLMCVLIWVVTCASSSPFILSGTIVRDNITRCFEPNGLSSWTRIMYMNYVALILGFLLPFGAILFFNGLLIKHITRNAVRISRIKKHVTMIVLVLLVFCVCFLPYHTQRTLHLHYLVHHPNSFALHRVLQKTVVATLCLAVTNSCLDPLLYVFLGQGFKSWGRLLCNKTKPPSSTNSSATKNGDLRTKTIEDFDVEMATLPPEQITDDMHDDPGGILTYPESQQCPILDHVANVR
ncbi:cysteinyl leukotriene receptor 2-like [Ambystoma mexicanum]|uniref:cysteinyl leukotriene receptor 2-like n=1 Tax=Ambystoma mexicanum TaxID=8296 RepID=UPI0037E72DD5